MICPYCQHELAEGDLACPRCETPFRGDPVGAFVLGIRKLVMGGVLVLFLTIMTVRFVLPDLPGGSRNPWGHSKSSQAQTTPPPDFRTPDLNRQLAAWSRGQQGGANDVPPFRH